MIAEYDGSVQATANRSLHSRYQGGNAATTDGSCQMLYNSSTASKIAPELSELAHRFESSVIAFDTAGAMMLRNQHRDGSMRTVAARTQWVGRPAHSPPRSPKLPRARRHATAMVCRCWPGYLPPSSPATKCSPAQSRPPQAVSLRFAEIRFWIYGEAKGVDLYSPGRAGMSR